MCFLLDSRLNKKHILTCESFSGSDLLNFSGKGFVCHSEECTGRRIWEVASWKSHLSYIKYSSGISSKHFPAGAWIGMKLTWHVLEDYVALEQQLSRGDIFGEVGAG